MRRISNEIICEGLRVSLYADVIVENDLDETNNSYESLQDVYIDFGSNGKVSILHLLNNQQYHAILNEL